MRLSTKSAAGLLATSHAAHALKATILADTNRDGVVDSADLLDKATWTHERGALFLANIGDTNQRCRDKLVPPELEDTTDQCGIPLDPTWESFQTEFYLDQCNDATGNVQRNAKYLAPLLTLPIEGEDLSLDATASVYISEDVGANRSRIFHKRDCGDWEYVDASRVFNVGEFENGMQLGIDARDVRRPDDRFGFGWDGLATVHFTITSGGKSVTDTVALRVAPVLTHHHGQRAERAFSSRDATFSKPQTQLIFADEFETNVLAAGVDEATIFDDMKDIWTQDYFEPGYTSIPGPDGPVVLRIMLRSAQPTRESGREVFMRLRSDSVGAVQHHHNGPGGSFDSTGNLEAVPPHTHNGVSYPAGRIIMGGSRTQDPDVVPFLRVQEEQDPILLDTDWLSVGHVDEFLQFLPYPNERGWVLMALDAVAGLELLQKAAADGHGGDPAVSRPQSLPTVFGMNCYWALQETIDDVMDFNLTAVTAYVHDKVQYNLDILKREVGITDEDIFYVPDIVTASNTGYWKRTCPGGRSEEIDTEEQAIRSVNHRSKVSSLQNVRERFAGPGTQADDILRAGTPPPSARLQYPKPEGDLIRRQWNGTKPCWERWEDFCDHHPLHSECNYNGPGEPDEGHATFGFVWSLYPSAINSVVLPGSRVLAANPWGPIIDGVDVMAEHVREAYGKVGYNVTFQDNWASHHLGGGEIHCGSNTWREADTVWWS